MCIYILCYAVNETEEVDILLSSDYCSCIEVSCEEYRSLVVAITNPDTTQKDIICSADISHTDSEAASGDVPCYFLSRCPSFNTTYNPFFRICQNPTDSSRCSVCFKNMINGFRTRLDFFWTQKYNCHDRLYTNRLYFKSIVINGKLIKWQTYKCILTPLQVQQLLLISQ